MPIKFIHIEADDLTKEQLESFLDLIRFGNPSGTSADPVEKQYVLDDPLRNFEPELGMFFLKTTDQGEESAIAVANGWGDTVSFYIWCSGEWKPANIVPAG